MKPPKCEVCETFHHSYQAHRFASAINKERLTGAINANQAINGPPPVEVMDLARKAVAAQLADTRTPEQYAADLAPALAGPGDEGTRSANGRKREDYNEYMREYMRKKRAGFVGVAYG